MSSEKQLALQFVHLKQTFFYTNSSNTYCCPNSQVNLPTKETDHLNSMVISSADNK